MITQELIEDALVHLEDMGFKYHLTIGLFKLSAVNDTLRNKNLYDLLKASDAYHQYELDYNTEISITRSDKVYNFTTWQKINSEISTAIKRITKEVDDVNIQTSLSEFSIEIPMSKKFQLSNIGEACNLFRKFNNIYSPHLVMYPEFHYQKGVVVYLRETPTSNHVRFDTFNGDIVKPGLKQSQKEFIDQNFNIVKTYENENEILEDNPYLVEKASSLSKYVIFELEPKTFKLINN